MSSISFAFFQNHTMTYNIILSFFYYIIHLEMLISKSYTTFVQYYNIIHFLHYDIMHYIIHVRFQHLPSLSSMALVVLRGVHRTNMNKRRRIAKKYIFHNCCDFFCYQTCIMLLAMLRIPSVLAMVIFSARVVWILNASSLGVPLCVL